MRLDDINPRYKTTEEAKEPSDMVKIPGMGLVHIGALQQNILRKLKDITAKVETGDPISTIEAHRLMHVASFHAMFDALVQGLEKQQGPRK